MKGLELSRAYYEEFGAPMLAEKFPEIAPLVAAGLVGAGSECFGFDDELSQDHDFEPGFCLFLPGEEIVDRRTAFSLERAYAKLPKEFMGFRRLDTPPEGGYRHGVIRIEDFYLSKIGAKEAFSDPMQWFSLPEYALAEATNGEVFSDPFGLFSSIREAMRNMPEDVRLKKLAGHLWMMGQSAPYNYERCLKHRENGAAKWALYEYVDHALSILFLLNRNYRPFYKWAFRASRSLPSLSDLTDPLEELLGAKEARAKELLSTISSRLVEALAKEGFCDGGQPDPSSSAFAVNDRIKDHHIRNLNILYGI